MEKEIKDFPRQFNFEPRIKNENKLGQNFKGVVVCGMGGSALAANLLSISPSYSNIKIHRSYGLPEGINTEETLFIFSSYSGNTEEVIDGLKTAIRKRLNLAVISTGGELLKIAEKKSLPYVKLLNTKIEPRLAVGFSFLAVLSIVNGREVEKLASLAKTLNVSKTRVKGKALAEFLWDKIPVVYSSTINYPLAYNWKIVFNESAKVPAFTNIFPELNHNEMTSYDWIETTKSLGEKICFVFLEDRRDLPKIKKRMKVCKKLLENRDFKVFSENLSSEKSDSFWHPIFDSWLVANWTAFYLSEYYGTEPDNVPMIENFKKLIK